MKEFFFDKFLISFKFRLGYVVRGIVFCGAVEPRLKGVFNRTKNLKYAPQEVLKNECALYIGHTKSFRNRSLT